MERKKLVILISLGFLVILLAALLVRDGRPPEPGPDGISGEEFVQYKNSEYGPEFAYPRSWGGVSLRPGNPICPEEDTYRTPDTLSVYDWEFSFPEKKLPGSDSFIRTGIRLYELAPARTNDCGDDFLLKLARKEFVPETISSFKLSSVTIPSGLEGVYNSEASRLNTEARTQYTFFIPSGTEFYVIQPYMSFIPHFGSPELAEMEQVFKGEMDEYLSGGATAGNIRIHRKNFEILAKSLNFSTE